MQCQQGELAISASCLSARPASGWQQESRTESHSDRGGRSIFMIHAIGMHLVANELCREQVSWWGAILCSTEPNSISIPVRSGLLCFCFCSSGRQLSPVQGRLSTAFSNSFPTGVAGATCRPHLAAGLLANRRPTSITDSTRPHRRAMKDKYSAESAELSRLAKTCFGHLSATPPPPPLRSLKQTPSEIRLYHSFCQNSD